MSQDVGIYARVVDVEKSAKISQVISIYKNFLLTV
jgi:hypothetical protein